MGSWGVNFTSFVRRYQPLARDALAGTFPQGCLLTSHDPSRAAQGAIVYPLLKGARAVAEAAGDEVAEAERITVGRGPTNDLILVHPTASKAHAYVCVVGGQPCVVDVGSANGTFVRGARLEVGLRACLEPGVTELSFGELRLFRFDAPSLFDYLARLEPEPEPARRADSGRQDARAPGMDTQVLATQHTDLRGPMPERAAAQERWVHAMDALGKLLPSADRVEVFLAVNPKPIPIYRAESGTQPAEALKNVESLRWAIERIKLTLKQSGHEVLVFER